MSSAKRNQGTEKTVDRDEMVDALAKAVYEGEIVNFRLLFAPLSPARTTSPESFDMPKYAYLLPDDEMREKRSFRDCRAEVEKPLIIAHIEKELAEDRPAQLPWELVMLLGDRAVRRGRYSSAALAYELLRARARMQQEFYAQADAALDENDVPKAVRGYLVATGLAYDYAAFPEPLPMVPDFQHSALMLHAMPPQRPEDCIGLKEDPPLLQIALTHLLIDREAVTRLESRSVALRLEFLRELVRVCDPEWDACLQRFRDAREAARKFGKRLEELQRARSLAEELEESQEDDPRCIPAALLGRTIENGQWWQYLKELAGAHPAAVLFVSRQVVRDIEIILPRYSPASAVAQSLGVAMKDAG